MNTATSDHRNLEATVIVHKDGEEGTLTIQAQDGKIVTPDLQRPDWAEGLGVAVVQERTRFYETRFGKDSTQFKAILDQTQAIEFSDLIWLGVDAAGEPIEITYDANYRSEIVAKALGIDTDEGTMSLPSKGERELQRQHHTMSQQEFAELNAAKDKGFNGQEQAQEDKQTATR
jgi:hypothetical protein